MSLLLMHVAIQIQFSVDNSNVVQALREYICNAYARRGERPELRTPVALITLMPRMCGLAINHIFAPG